MEQLEERLSYVQGLAEGINLPSQTPEGRILKEVLHLLDDVSRELREIKNFQEALQDYVESLEEDLNEVVQWLEQEDWDEGDEWEEEWEEGDGGEGEDSSALEQGTKKDAPLMQ